MWPRYTGRKAAFPAQCVHANLKDTDVQCNYFMKRVPGLLSSECCSNREGNPGC